MFGEAITVVTGLVLAYALVAHRLTAANISAPMLSLLAGAAVFAGTALDVDTELVHVTAEVTLVMILFHDASTVMLTRLRHDAGLSLRLLLIGFPLAIVATFLVTHALFPALGIAGAWLLAAAITPTDAGLGAPTVLNPVVPMRVRRGLNVESGLNDGLATPIVLLALSALASGAGEQTPGVLQVGLIPVALAVALAVAVGLAAAWSMDRSRARHLSGRRGRQVATFAIPLLLFGLADQVGANAFIAAFVGGVVFGAASITLDDEHETSDLLEVSADLLSFVVWFLAGGILLLVLDAGFRWQWAILAVLALTVLRILPVALSLIGTGLRVPTVLFIGWFGPRGLATIVFGLLAVEELGSGSALMTDVGGVIGITVVLSAFAHGISAGPLSGRYGRWAERTDPVAEGSSSVEPRRTRGTMHHHR
ncbi:MAG: cation:proton antiporter [Candidatus Nanopelagicales bacterium]